MVIVEAEIISETIQPYKSQPTYEGHDFELDNDSAKSHDQLSAIESDDSPSFDVHVSLAYFK